MQRHTAAPYRFTTFDALSPNGRQPSPEPIGAINNSGEVVGYTLALALGPPPFRFDAFAFSGGSVTNIDVPGATLTEAFGINDRGAIVGFYNTNPLIRGPRLPNLGFLYENGSYTTIAVAGAGETIPLVINDRGEIAGYYVDGNDPNFLQHAFVYQHGSFTTIDPPGTANSSAIGINDRGDVLEATFSYTMPTSDKFVIYHHGTYTDINLPGTALTTVAEPPSYPLFSQPLGGINDRGEVVGAYLPTGGGLYDAVGFLYDHGAVTTIAVPGATRTEALAINNRGEIAGYYNGSYMGNVGIYGFVYEDGRFTTIAVAGASDTWAYGINDRGQVTGVYRDSSGDHGFIASPQAGGHGFATGDGPSENLGDLLAHEAGRLSKDDLLPWTSSPGGNAARSAHGAGSPDQWTGGSSGAFPSFAGPDLTMDMSHPAPAPAG